MRGHCVQCAQDRQTGWTFDVVVLCEMAIRAGQYTIKSNAICVSEQMKWQRDRCIIVVCGEDLIKSVCGRLLWIRLWPSFGIFDGGLALHFVHTHTHTAQGMGQWRVEQRIVINWPTIIQDCSSYQHLLKILIIISKSMRNHLRCVLSSTVVNDIH